MADTQYPVHEELAAGQAAGYVGSPATFDPPDPGGTNTSDLTGIGDPSSVTPAAFVDPTTATPEAICNALITAGLMAAS